MFNSKGHAIFNLPLTEKKELKLYKSDMPSHKQVHDTNTMLHRSGVICHFLYNQFCIQMLQCGVFDILHINIEHCENIVYLYIHIMCVSHLHFTDSRL